MSRHAAADLYCVANALARVGCTFLNNQRDAIYRHVITSSILNPTPTLVTPPPPPAAATEHSSEEPAAPQAHVAKECTAGDLNMEEAPSTPPEYSAGEATTVSPPPTLQENNNTPMLTLNVDAPVDEAMAAQEPRKVLKESRIPTTRIGRLWHYGTLATGLGVGALSESFKRATGLSNSQGSSVMLNEKNVDLLVEKISRMRGAALKMGQMLSIQGIQGDKEKDSWIPPQMEQILLRVHDSANYMPRRQMEVNDNSISLSFLFFFFLSALPLESHVQRTR